MSLYSAKLRLLTFRKENKNGDLNCNFFAKSQANALWWFVMACSWNQDHDVVLVVFFAMTLDLLAELSMSKFPKQNKSRRESCAERKETEIACHCAEFSFFLFPPICFFENDQKLLAAKESPLNGLAGAVGREKHALALKANEKER